MIPFVLADHTLISAVPFLVPALIIIGFLAFHVIRDRRADDGAEPEVYDDDWAAPVASGDDDAADPGSGDDSGAERVPGDAGDRVDGDR